MIRPDSSVQPSLPVTRARARLFELVDALLDGRIDRVALEHRDHADSVVMMRRAELTALEAKLAALRATGAPEPRPLRGLATLAVDAADALRDLRAREAEREELRLRSFGPSEGGA